MLPPFLADFLFPFIGTVICNILWITPLPVVLEARYTRNLGPINPYPFALIAIAQIGWTLYGCVRKDIFLFTSSFLGVPFGFYYTIVCLTVIAKKDANSDFSSLYIGVETFLLCGLLFWTIIGYVAAAGFDSWNDPLGEAKLMVGTICCALSIAYYTSPLTSLMTILREQDSSSLFLPLICVNLLNSSMWLLYGLLGTQDINLILPNSIGVSLSLFQIALRLIIPVKEKPQTQTLEHVLHLIQGKIPPSFATSEKHLTVQKKEQEQIWERERSMSIAERVSQKMGFSTEFPSSVRILRGRTLSSLPAVQEERDIEAASLVKSPIFPADNDAPY